MSILKEKSNKRALHAMQTKKKLYETSLNLFIRYGFDKVTIEDITQTAGLSKGSFYVYFKSKESILLEVFHQIDNKYDEAFSSIPAQMSGRERILLLMRTMSSYCSNDVGIDFMKIVYANQIQTSHKVNILNDSSRRFYYYIRHAVITGKANKEFPDMNDNELTELFARLARSIIYDWCLYNGTFDLEERTLKYFTFILDSFKAYTAAGNEEND